MRERIEKSIILIDMTSGHMLIFCIACDLTLINQIHMKKPANLNIILTAILLKIAIQAIKNDEV